MKSLLLGAGNNRHKKIAENGSMQWLGDLVTLDMDPDCKPTVLWNIENRPLPFADGEFDELAAYDVLEHIGRQGDWKGYFDEMAEYHRILKDGGIFGIVVPTGREALADPGHTRFFHQNHFGFLCQDFYVKNLERRSPVTDYRWYWKLNFDLVNFQDVGGHHLGVVLRKTNGPICKNGV